MDDDYVETKERKHEAKFLGRGGKKEEMEGNAMWHWISLKVKELLKLWWGWG